MPVIARFYGILIKMYFREHGVPHFHAVYAEFNGVFDVTTLDMIEGDLPPRAQRLVRDRQSSTRMNSSGCGKRKTTRSSPVWSRA